jgi:hypothetical protein
MRGPLSALQRRLAFTVLVPVAVALVDRLPLPGLHPEALSPYLPDNGPLLSLFSFGLGPATSAALLVEIAALAVPRWRPLRHDGPVGRARLSLAALVATVVLASIQSFFIYRWLERTSEDILLLNVVPDSAAGRLVLCVSLVTGAVLLFGLTRLVAAHGLGCGFSVLLAGIAVPRILGELSVSLKRAYFDREVLQALVLPAVGLVVLALATARDRRRHPSGAPAAFVLPTPSSTILPLSVVVWLLAMRPQLAAFGLDLPDAVDAFWQDVRARALVLAGLAVLLAWLQARPALVAPVWRRASAGDAAPAAGPAFRRGLLASLLYLGVLGAIFTTLERVRIGLDLFGALMVLCVALDVGAEWLFRRARGDVAAVWPEHRLYAVRPALDRLEQAGIPAFARGLRHRTLLGFLGPYVPVDLLVPATHAAQAGVLLETIFLQSRVDLAALGSS